MGQVQAGTGQSPGLTRSLLEINCCPRPRTKSDVIQPGPGLTEGELEPGMLLLPRTPSLASPHLTWLHLVSSRVGGGRL